MLTTAGRRQWRKKQQMQGRGRCLQRAGLPLDLLQLLIEGPDFRVLPAAAVRDGPVAERRHERAHGRRHGRRLTHVETAFIPLLC